MSIKVYPYGFCSSDFIVQMVCSILASSRAECPLLSICQRTLALLELQNRYNCVSYSLLVGLEMSTKRYVSVPF